jgi:putative flippase GtrA
MNVIALIPAYKPAPALVDMVRQLAEGGFDKIVVVDDGGGAAFAPIFDRLRQVAGVTVLPHAVNLGKGAALKTGLNHICITWPEAAGTVTIDADGQHSVADSLRVAQALMEKGNKLVVGARAFDGKVPLRSRFGNTLTRKLFGVLVGYPLRDTQSGLRGIPHKLALQLLTVRSQRYEFELDMLLLCKHVGVKVVEIPISTIYIDGNESSHFNPLLDSLKIYFALLRFSMASLLTALLDNCIFITLISSGWPIAASQMVARGTAASANYIMVKNFVFLSKHEHRRALPRFCATVVILGFISYGMIIFLSEYVGLPVIAAKLMVETLIYLGNFLIQRDLVFQSSER